MYYVSLIKNITFEHKAYCVMKTHSTAFMEFSPKSKSQGKNYRATVALCYSCNQPLDPINPTIQVDTTTECNCVTPKSQLRIFTNTFTKLNFSFLRKVKCEC